MKASSSNFWNQLENQQLSKNEVEKQLILNLGQPTNLTQQNLLQEFCKKVKAYYFTFEPTNTAIYSLYGQVQEIQAKQYKEGKRKGQTYYLLNLAEPKGEKLKASQADLPADKWTQLEKLALLGQKLVFTYRKWITNKELLDFEKPKKNQITNSAKLKIRSDKAETG